VLSLFWRYEESLKKRKQKIVLAKAFRKPIPRPYFYWEKNAMTRGEAAEARYAGQMYDHALPDGWVDACKERGLDPVGHFVWLYDDWIGRPAPITDEGERIVSLLARLP